MVLIFLTCYPVSASPFFLGVSPDAARGLMGLGNEGEGSGFYTLKEGGESATAFALFSRLSLVCRRPGNRAIGTWGGGKCGHRKKNRTHAGNVCHVSPFIFRFLFEHTSYTATFVRPIYQCFSSIYFRNPSCMVFETILYVFDVNTRPFTLLLLTVSHIRRHAGYCSKQEGDFATPRNSHMHCLKWEGETGVQTMPFMSCTKMTSYY